MIYHLEVGNKDFTPTNKDLEKVIEEFKKPLPVFTVPVKVHELCECLSSRLIIHINDKDWNPSPEEVGDIRSQFENARGHNDSIVATRKGVTASYSIPYTPKDNDEPTT